MKVFIVGGGPAGMMCAITSARNGADVTIIEKNEKLGKKLYITGKGRCNLTNKSDIDNYMNNIVTNNKFMISSLREFDSDACINFFESLGLSLKTERGNRVFPASDKSSDVINVLKKEIERLNITVLYNETVIRLNSDNKSITEIITDKNTYVPDKVIIATGGITYPLTGSTGSGYRFGEATGHKIIPQKPGLVGLKLKKDYADLPKMQGISLKNVTASIIEKNTNKKIFEEFGEMLFTQTGVSGPIILTLSSRINRLNFNSLKLSVDLKPSLTEKQLDARLLKDFSKNINKQLKNSLSELLPSGLILPFIIKSDIAVDKTVNTITKEERKRLVHTLKNFDFDLLDTEPVSSGIITSGGICVRDINPKTFQSKLIKNLYFIGEVIDVDALTGGYNLQIAFSTGYCAGKHIFE